MPFGIRARKLVSGARYTESTEEGVSVLQIHQSISPHVDAPPPIQWMQRNKWEGLPKRSTIQIRETQKEIFVSLTMGNRPADKVTCQLLGKRLRIAESNSAAETMQSLPFNPMEILLPGQSGLGKPIMQSRTNDLVVIRIRKQDAVPRNAQAH